MKLSGWRSRHFGMWAGGASCLCGMDCCGMGDVLVASCADYRGSSAGAGEGLCKLPVKGLMEVVCEGGCLWESRGVVWWRGRVKGGKCEVGFGSRRDSQFALAVGCSSLLLSAGPSFSLVGSWDNLLVTLKHA